MPFPTVSQLKQALVIAEKLESLEAELAAILGSSSIKRKYTKSDSSAAPKAKKAKRVMSPEAREKIAAAQRKRWAKQKKVEKKVS